MKKKQKFTACPALARITLIAAFVVTLSLGTARCFADAASVSISDLEENEITAFVAGDLFSLGRNYTVTNRPDEPEKLVFSVASDGSATAGRGIALLLESDGKVSDLLDVTTTQQTRGGNQPYISASITFISDTNETGLDLSFLNLSPELMQMIMTNALVEDGTFQDLGLRLINIDTDPGKRLNPISTITVASDMEVPEPSSSALLVAGFVGMAHFRRRVLIAKRRNPPTHTRFRN